ncbi:hypothetical protein BD626DRAFT_277298 [Schizophyllum amplum]|uniref:Uncharacterized protein n=1 Tax=Schizophyllum amplum TaxID=97359 RepID=A0A550BTE7_9AGAR|nr:hypothetical protein BD626DRAFT_277298 [Auriculariopsis ampla]
MRATHGRRRRSRRPRMGRRGAPPSSSRFVWRGSDGSAGGDDAAGGDAGRGRRPRGCRPRTGAAQCSEAAFLHLSSFMSLSSATHDQGASPCSLLLPLLYAAHPDKRLLWRVPYRANGSPFNTAYFARICLFDGACWSGQGALHRGTFIERQLSSRRSTLGSASRNVSVHVPTQATRMRAQQAMST